MICSVLLTLCLPVVVSSCGEDRWPAYYPQTKYDLWIDSVMRSDYMWAHEMPSSKELTSNYFSDPVTFLKAVRSSSDEVSYIDTAYYDSRTYGYGYSCSLYSISDTAYAALVTYVDADSPASDISLQRGDWIMGIDNRLITSGTRELLTDGDSHALTVGHYGTVISDGDTLSTITADRIAVIPAATYYTPDEVPVVAIVNGAVGYIVCNNLSSSNISRLAAATRSFSNAGVGNVVLDLRYCNAGDTDGAVFLASAMLTAADEGLLLGYHSYADSLRKPRLEFYSVSADSYNGSNLGLETLYVLTGADTSGASETLINCLKPYIDVVIIGETTAGEDIECTTYRNEHLGLRLHLATSAITNSQGSASYSGTGFTPDYAVSPLADPATVLPLGDASEALLSKALETIGQ